MYRTKQKYKNEVKIIQNYTKKSKFKWYIKENSKYVIINLIKGGFYMINFVSKVDDVIWLYYKLKDEMAEKISVNELGLYQEVLSGKYYDENDTLRNKGMNFSIKYSKDEFLRVTICDYQSDKTYEEKINALIDFYLVLNRVKQENGEALGEPLAIYNVKRDNVRTPYLEWAFTKQDEYIQELENDTLFDDGSITDLLIFSKEPEKENPKGTNKQIKKKYK